MPRGRRKRLHPANFDILVIGSGLDFVYLRLDRAVLNSQAAAFATYFNTQVATFTCITDQGIGQSFYNFLPTFGATQAAIGVAGQFSPTAGRPGDRIDEYDC